MVRHAERTQKVGEQPPVPYHLVLVPVFGLGVGFKVAGWRGLAFRIRVSVSVSVSVRVRVESW